MMEIPRRPIWRWLKVLTTIGVVVAVGVGVIGTGRYLGRFLNIRFASNQTTTVVIERGLPVKVEIPSGASAGEIATILAQAGVISSIDTFNLAVKTSGAEGDLKAGRYDLTTGMLEGEALAALRLGPVVATLKVVIPEGLRVGEILDRLAEAFKRPREDFEKALLGGSVISNVVEFSGETELQDWDGLLFPATYDFFEDATPESVLQLLADTMERRLELVDWLPVEDAGLTVYDGIIIASLIESEVRVGEERQLVSSVIYNRLDQAMRLEIDATVLYALDTRKISEFNRKVDSPYNTYRVDGLPPGPISAPGLASLQAAAAPEATDFLFYVLSSKDGHHTFTKTLEEHEIAVKKAKKDGVIP